MGKSATSIRALVEYHKGISRNHLTMLTLYYEPGCPYCQKVLDAGEELGLTFNKRSVDDFGVNDELIARGGSQKVPYLIDDEDHVEMYESDAIVKYLHERFG